MSIGLNLFSRPCEFIAGAATLESLPVVTHPEIAFIGRSNVGKSSLINALVGQKSLARTSQNPGATQQLNFFLLNASEEQLQIARGLGGLMPNTQTPALMLVDMPGYGFAKVSKAQKGEWDHLIRHYLCGRPNLKRVFVLIDARRGAMPVDDEFMEMLDEAAVNFQIVLTKTDTISAKELAAAEASVVACAGRHVAAHPEFITTSSLTKQGISALQEIILPFAGSL
jgi:GTP-binding protein